MRWHGGSTRAFQPLFESFPIRAKLLQQSAELRAVVGVLEVADFGGDDVIDAGGGGFDKLGVEVNGAAFEGAAPAFGHGAQAEVGLGKLALLAPTDPRAQSLLELLLSMASIPRFQGAKLSGIFLGKVLCRGIGGADGNGRGDWEAGLGDGASWDQ